MLLKDYLKRYKIKTREFAKLLNMTPNYASQLINGHRKITRKNAKLIEEVTDGKVSRLECLYPEEYERLF